MNTLQLVLRPCPQPNPDGIAEFEMAVGTTLLTRLIRPKTNGTVNSVRIPAAPMGFWIADNWWRLRWEPKSGVPSDSWRMAHEMNAIGHGHAWPPVTIWGDRDRVMLVSRADPSGTAGPVRFLANAVTFVPGSDFEAAMDQLLEETVSAAPTTDQIALKAVMEALRLERSNPEHATWRRIEAVCGYGPDEAPETLITQILDLEAQYAPADVEEAVAAAPGDDTATTLSTSINQAASGATVDFATAVRLATSNPALPNRFEPWVMAEAAANALRQGVGQPTRPLLNARLAELGGISARHLGNHQPAGSPYAIRLGGKDRRQTILLTARWSHDRRFQFARAIGDAIWSNNSSLGTISSIATSRQKFQRAFAAALLCPESGLTEFLDTTNPTDSDITEAARRFHVNEKTVRSVLVNKHLMERRRLGEPLSDPLDSSRLEELADAA